MHAADHAMYDTETEVKFVTELEAARGQPLTHIPPAVRKRTLGTVFLLVSEPTCVIVM